MDGTSAEGGGRVVPSNGLGTMSSGCLLHLEVIGTAGRSSREEHHGFVTLYRAIIPPIPLCNEPQQRHAFVTL